MKYSVKLTRKDGKTVTLAANEYIDIDVEERNKLIARMRVQDGKVYDDELSVQDNEIEPRACENHAHYRASCAECIESNN